MKKYIKLLVGVLLAAFSSCGNDEHAILVPGTDKELSIIFTTKVPVSRMPSTRAVSEDALSSVTVLVFENTGSGYRFAYQVQGYNLAPGSSSTEYTFLARITPSTNPIKLYLLGNASGLTGGLAAGDTEAAVRTSLVQPFTTAGFDGTIPMFGEVEFASGLVADTPVDAVLVRSIARANVQSSTADFVLNSVYVYRASDQYQIIPNDLPADNIVTAASIPAGTTQSVNLPRVTAPAGISFQQIYLPESPLPTVAGRQNATVLVVGGFFGDDTVETFYRLDFVPSSNESLFGQILRNHSYDFTITGALASGWRTPDEAAQYPSSQMEAEIKVWNDNTVYMVFDDVSYFGVSSRLIEVPAPIGSTQSIEVDTNLETYNLYWADTSGNIIDNTPITPGGNFISPDGLFRATISPDGTTITTEALSTGANGAYLLAEAGRLQVLLTIQQNVTGLIFRPLNVYGSLEEIGSLGDNVFTTGIGPRDRTGGMVPIMRNTNNFGANGVVPIEEISIAGTPGYGLTASYFPLFDVIYRTYNTNTNVNNQEILNWLAASNRRVLILQCDNAATNSQMRSLLSVSLLSPANTSVAPYRFSPDAPAVIMDGPFGTIDPDALIRCYDTTHGEIMADGNITPVLLGPGGQIALGIDFDRRIVYCGDIDIYNNKAYISTQIGEFIRPSAQSEGGLVSPTNNAEKLIANLWAWIATVCLTE